MLDEPELGAMEAGRRAGLSGQTGCAWVKRFNAGGLGVLEDAPRGGRPPTHPPDVRSRLVNVAVQKPKSLGLPFELWTLARLQREFWERERVHLSDSTIWTWLRGEGLHWRRQQTWFRDAERHDPEFVEKMGAIIRAYTAPPEGCRVICIDELGPLSAKTYPGEEYVPRQRRATFEPDYGRRGTLWVHGAFEPATEEAALVFSDRRDGASHTTFGSSVRAWDASPETAKLAALRQTGFFRGTPCAHSSHEPGITSGSWRR